MMGVSSYSETKIKGTKNLLKYTILYTFLCGLIAHGFGLLNLYPSHDALSGFFSDKSSYLWQISLGRVLEPVYKIATATIAVMPWLEGLLSLLWIALAVFLTAQIFDVTKQLELFIMAGIFVTNKTILALTATYMPWMSADTFALLTSVLAVYLWKKFILTGEKKYIISGIVCITLTLGIYQSYIAVTIFLILAFSMFMLLNKRRAKQVVVNGISAVTMIVVGGGAYFILMRLALYISQSSLQSSYNSVSNLWNNQEPVYARVIWTYRQVFDQFFRDINSLYPEYILIVSNIFIFLICCAGAIFVLRKNKIFKIELLLLLVLLLLIPFSVNIVRMLNSETHCLMYFAFWLIYLLPIFLFELILKIEIESKVIKCMRNVLYALLMFVLITNIQTSNLVYTEKQIQYNSTLSIMTIVLHDIETQEGYIAGKTPVVFVGTPGDVLTELPAKEYIKSIIGVSANSAITYDYDAYFKNILQRDIQTQDIETVDDKTVIEDMPVYPAKGYVDIIDGKVIVKFGEQL